VSAAAVRSIRDRRLYKVKRTAPVAGRYSFETWEDYCAIKQEMSHDKAERMIVAASTVEGLKNHANLRDFFPSKVDHVRPLLRLENEHERAAAWQAVIA
jgi:hypothetical protein